MRGEKRLLRGNNLVFKYKTSVVIATESLAEPPLSRQQSVFCSHCCHGNRVFHSCHTNRIFSSRHCSNSRILLSHCFHDKLVSYGATVVMPTALCANQKRVAICQRNHSVSLNNSCLCRNQCCKFLRVSIVAHCFLLKYITSRFVAGVVGCDQISLL